MAQVRTTIHPATTHHAGSAPAVQFRPKTTPRYYQPELQLDRKFILFDLMRTLGVTTALIVLQVLGWAYLQQGGWDKVLGVMRQLGV